MNIYNILLHFYNIFTRKLITACKWKITHYLFSTDSGFVVIFSHHRTVSIEKDIFIHLVGEESTNHVIFLSNRNGVTVSARHFENKIWFFF